MITLWYLDTGEQAAEIVEFDDLPLDEGRVRYICDLLFPHANQSGDENYKDVLNECRGQYSIKTCGELKRIIRTHKAAAIDNDIEHIKTHKYSKGTDDYERTQRGVFFNYIGLLRICLEKEEWQVRRQ